MSDRRGEQADKFPVRADVMAKACRDLAAVYHRAEAAGHPRVAVLHGTITCGEAANRLLQQAGRWDDEMRTGIPNAADRAKLRMRLG
jgi:hypothetical protein